MSRFQWLWFLHADTLIDSDVIKLVIKRVKSDKNTTPLYFFKLGFYNRQSNFLKLTEIATYFRSRTLKIPFGDQGFLLTKETFKYLDSYDEDVGYGEDHLLIWKAHQRRINVEFLNALLLTNARKYNHNGWLKQTFKHWVLWLKQAIPQVVILVKQRLSFKAPI